MRTRMSRRTASPGDRPCRDRGGRTVLELDPAAQAGGVALGRAALDLREVLLLDAVARVGEPVRELAVVREGQQALRLAVQAPHREDARLVRQEASQVRRGVWVAHRGRAP